MREFLHLGGVCESCVATWRWTQHVLQQMQNTKLPANWCNSMHANQEPIIGLPPSALLLQHLLYSLLVAYTCYGCVADLTCAFCYCLSWCSSSLCTFILAYFCSCSTFRSCCYCDAAQCVLACFISADCTVSVAALRPSPGNCKT